MRRSLTPYSLPIIPCPLPSEIVDGEHFVTVDMLNLIAGSASPSRDLEAKTSSRELVSRTPSVPSTSTSRDSNPAQLAPRRGERGSRLEILPLPRKGTSSAPRVLKIKKGGKNREKKAPEAQVKDFVPWVHPEPSWPSDLEEEEEEDEMTGLLTLYTVRKRKRQESAEKEDDHAEGSNRPTTDGGSKMQAIVILGLPEMGSSDQPGPKGVALGEPREVTPIPPAL